MRAGNGTLEAARQLGWSEIQITRADLSGHDAAAFAIADNRSAELAEWDELALAETLRSLESEDFELAAVGFTEDELNARLAALTDAILPPDADGKEYDESVENEVVYCTCPECEHTWPR